MTQTHALCDNTKLIKTPEHYIFDMCWWEELFIKKVERIKKLKRLIMRRKEKQLRP